MACESGEIRRRRPLEIAHRFFNVKVALAAIQDVDASAIPNADVPGCSVDDEGKMIADQLQRTPKSDRLAGTACQIEFRQFISSMESWRMLWSPIAGALVQYTMQRGHR